ncbi:hypothetical protein DWU95_24315 [Burkholderia contaminans]|nr:hypothetical protein DWU95_24315 [Burkholderia contaminans]
MIQVFWLVHNDAIKLGQQLDCCRGYTALLQQRQCGMQLQYHYSPLIMQCRQTLAANLRKREQAWLMLHQYNLRIRFCNTIQYFRHCVISAHAPTDQRISRGRIRAVVTINVQLYPRVVIHGD